MPSKPSPPDHQRLLALVAEHHPKIAPGLLAPLLDLLSVSRAACGGDVDKFLILLVVGVRTAEHAEFATYTEARLMSGEIPVLPSLGINVASVAESLGVPKETVRRKVGELVDAGWIARRGHELHITGQVFTQLAHVRAAIEQLAVRNYEVVSDLLRREALPEAEG
jgi:DNA-binding MarR family transcriptional regulator